MAAEKDRPVAVPGTYLFTAVRNEAPFLIEWIAYHKVIGFENIIVAANPSTDGTDELLAALAEAGEITFVPHDPPEGVGPQRHAARLANERQLIPDGAWASWLDADEFLNVKCGNGRLEALIDEIGRRVCILVPWRIFGDGGNKTFQGRHLSESFILASADDFPHNREVKSFFRKGNGIVGLSVRGINRPLLSGDPGLGKDSVMTGSGAVLSNSDINNRWLSGRDFAKTRRIDESEHGYSIAQINHYSIRTAEHYLLKRMRGRGYEGHSEGEANTRHTAETYHEYNRNECEDRSILRWEAQTGREMDRMLAIPAVGRAYDQAMDKVRAEIARLPAEKLAELRTLPARPAKARPAADPETRPPVAGAETSFKLTLPDDAAEALRGAYAAAQVVLEYGSGGSTFLALDAGVGFVASVESDAQWALGIGAALSARFAQGRFLVHHADIGPTKAWGQPADRSGFRRYHLYATEIWDHPQFRHPDVVLIDGRFRVACFLTTMIRCTRPVTVLFDDYIDRHSYHWIEELFPVQDMAGRMARFTVAPRALPPEYLTRFAAAFTDPR
ncbi:glycosyltransferase family 2 protein [Paracoccus alkenifer]|uniref:Glycosyl transferase family 2 n=1 Tax=Paracoccus alkenifer TaxID=65735 RepID=A0A1H6L923_9RHOB|nr:glycosyltransferase family 2 protein [Paracoccus alkenifer]SEH80768.1 Glycosyl transferase family 2 [Paracoccus alkenifer]